MAAWAAHQPDEYHFDCLLSGPAVAIFCQRLNNANIISRDFVALQQYDRIITSTSSAETGWETVWILKAKERGIKTISILDHWTNYLSRFLLQGNYIFPDEIWVCDDYAQDLALACQQQLNTYPAVIQIPNYYLMDQVHYIHDHQKAPEQVEHTLFVSEPSNNPLYTAQSALEDFIEFAIAVSPGNKVLRLRLHPREQISDYEAVCSHWNEKLAIHYSPNSRLEDDLCWATWVVGCQTMAMVVALSAGSKVSSCLPASVAKSALPHREIPRIFQ